MFERLKKAFSGFGKKVEGELPAEPAEKKKFSLFRKKAEKEEPAAEAPPAEKKRFFERVREKRELKKQEAEARKVERAAERDAPRAEKAEETGEERRGILRALSETKISEDKFEALFEELEDELLQANVSAKIVEKIKADLQKEIVGKPLSRAQISERIKERLSALLLAILTAPAQVDLLELAKAKKPLVILFVGVNGVGKTTTVAKLAKLLLSNGLSCVMAAGDTWRAAAIEQLEHHADKLGVKLIKHKYGADSAAVAYDAVEHAKAKGLNAVLIDTAGRQHINEDLMAELAKVKRVAKPDVVILVVDSLTGNDATEQARFFSEKIGIDGAILTKADADERGGAIVSVGYETGKPILYIGRGQAYGDLEKFDAEKIVRQIIL